MHKTKSSDGAVQNRILILCATTGYQTRAFVAAAEKLGLAVVFGTDRCHVLEDPWQDGALPLRFEDPEGAARRIMEYAGHSRIDGIVSLGDRPTLAAARASRALKLLHHPPEAVEICRDKYLSRERLREIGLNVPAFRRFDRDSEPQEILDKNPSIKFPCILKPLALSASRGVIRADTPEEFISAFERIRMLLRSPDVQAMREGTSQFIQVEAYVEGQELAVEGLVDRGRLQVLAIFDKPDPLVGPYFEETIYVTPSRLEPETQTAVIDILKQAVLALGLYHGPIHAELRLNSRGLWILEVAARSIGGFCSRALRFTQPASANKLSLEELIIGLALGNEVHQVCREDVASGVMMIPIPEGGIFERADGIEEALETPGVDEIHITAKVNQKLIPLPEGSSYLGFIFARGATPEFVETALRQAHQKLRFVISRALPVVR